MHHLPEMCDRILKHVTVRRGGSLMTQPDKPTSSGPAKRKPYSTPQLTSYGHIKDIVQGDAGMKNDGGGDKSKT
jgi:hypothetical protein